MGMELRGNIENEEHCEMDDGGDFSDHEIALYVRNALKSVESEGYNDHYEELVGVMNTTKYLAPDKLALLVASLKALSRAVSCIDSVYHRNLLASIFGMNLWNYGPEVMDALVELIINLAAVGGKFVDLCLDMLVNNFAPPQSFLCILDQPRGMERKEQVLDRVHSALIEITKLVPLAPLRLETAIVHRMPYIYAKGALTAIYVESMLRLESSVLGKFVGTRVLTEVVTRLIDLDVEIGWDEILQDDYSKGIFDMELEDIEENEDYAGNDSIELLGGTLELQNFRGDLFPEKLDSLMVITCEHLKSCADGGRLVEVFETLLVTFEKVVLTAYKSKFAQFVMFYACSLDPENCGVRFAVTLADLFEHATYPLIRMSAVAYLASYLSRGRFLSPSLVAGALERLVGWCFKYCEHQDGEEKIINPEGHRVFYSACQAIMYVLCFRMKYMMDLPHLKSQLMRLPLEAILQHPLDPLKVCLPSIVKEFLRQAKAANLFSVSEKIFLDNMLESDLSKAFGGKERLDMFFPFDPLLLKTCDRFIRPHFLYWSMVKTSYDEDEDGNSEEDEVFVDDRNGHFLHDDDDMGRRSYDEDRYELDEFEDSLNKMSITPKCSLKHRLASDLQISMRMPARIRPSTSPESL